MLPSGWPTTHCHCHYPAGWGSPSAAAIGVPRPWLFRTSFGRHGDFPCPPFFLSAVRCPSGMCPASQPCTCGWRVVFALSPDRCRCCGRGLADSNLALGGQHHPQPQPQPQPWVQTQSQTTHQALTFPRNIAPKGRRSQRNPYAPSRAAAARPTLHHPAAL